MPPQTPLKTGAWDPEEDDLLYYWQGKVGNKWSEIAKHIPGRTGQQCAQRWRHKVNPNIRRDKWSNAEDAHLMDLVKTFGIGKWAEIARHMQGRTDQQCMGRWRRHLDPNIRRDSWSAEEDARLRALHQQYGTSWSRISKALKGRTSQQCRARWHQLDSGRSRRSGGGGAFGGAGSGSGEQGSTAGGGRSGGSSKRRAMSRARRGDYDSASDYSDDYEDDDEGLSDSGAEDGVGGFGMDGGEGAAMLAAAPGPFELPMHNGGVGYEGGAGPRRHIAARKQPQLPEGGAAAPLLPPLVGGGTSPRRPPRLVGSTPGSGMSTPRRRGGGTLDSPALNIMSPALFASPGATPAGHHHLGNELGGSPEHGWQQVAQAQGLDDDEAAGAEILLHMAATATRRGSGGHEPPSASLRRGDFVTGHTPTKRSPARRPETRLSDDLSPSPFKKAHSLTGDGGAAELLAGATDFRRRLAAAAAAGEAVGDDEGDEQQQQDAADAGATLPNGAAAGLGGRSGARKLTAKRSGGMPRHGSGSLPFRDGDGDDVMDDATAEVDGSEMRPVAFDLGAVAGGTELLGSQGAAGDSGLASPPAQRASGAAVALAARRGLGTEGITAPPKQAMNLLASPKFDHLTTGCGTPLTGAPQPSPATLALLQSPQPCNAVLEPFWTPYTGLAKESLLHGTAGGAGPSIFSPPAPRTCTAQNPAEAAGPSASAAVSLVPKQEPGAAVAQELAAEGADSGEACAEGGGLGNNRVVRRLDQHEAWGGGAQEDDGAPTAVAGHPPAVGQAPAELASPPKRPRVPLFCDATAGVADSGTCGSPDAVSPPQRADSLKLEFEAANGGTSQPSARAAGAARSYEPSRLGPASGARGAVTGGPAPSAAASGLGRSPGRLTSWKLPPASALLGSPTGTATETRRGAPLNPAIAEAAAAVAQQQQQQQQQHPSTPVHTRPINGQSTSATPTTPSFQAAEGGGAGGVASPSDFVTPQQRVRLAPPTAPLHRDCLLAAAASAAARLAAAAVGGSGPPPTDGDGPGTVSSKAPLQGTGHVDGPASLPGPRVAESSSISASPAEPPRPVSDAGPSAAWDAGMIAMLQGMQPHAAAAGMVAGAAAAQRMLNSTDAAEVVTGAAVPMAAASAPPCTPACGSRRQLDLAPAGDTVLATPCGAAAPVNPLAPAATPASALLASALSSATPLVLAGLAAAAHETPLATAFHRGAPPAGTAVDITPGAGPAGSLTAPPIVRAAPRAACPAEAAAPGKLPLVGPLAIAAAVSALTQQPPQAALGPSATSPAAAAIAPVLAQAAPGREVRSSAAARSRLQALLEGL